MISRKVLYTDLFAFIFPIIVMLFCLRLEGKL